MSLDLVKQGRLKKNGGPRQTKWQGAPPHATERSEGAKKNLGADLLNNHSFQCILGTVYIQILSMTGSFTTYTDAFGQV